MPKEELNDLEGQTEADVAAGAKVIAGSATKDVLPGSNGSEAVSGDLAHDMGSEVGAGGDKRHPLRRKSDGQANSAKRAPRKAPALAGSSGKHGRGVRASGKVTRKEQHFIAVPDRVRRAVRIVSTRYEMNQPHFLEKMMEAPELYESLVDTYSGLGEK